MANTAKNIIKNHSYFADCSQGFVEKQSQDAVFLKKEKGNVLFVQDEPAERYYLLLKGWVKLYRETRDGEQAILDIVTQNQLFGDASILDNRNHAYTAELIEDAELLSFPIEALDAEVKQNHKFSMFLLGEMAKRHKYQNKEIEHRSLQTAPQRIGCFLLRLTDPNGKVLRNINLPYDKTLIAAQLGMKPETFSRALKKLKEETGIGVQGSNIEIHNPEKLASFACSACSSEFPCSDV